MFRIILGFVSKDSLTLNRDLKLPIATIMFFDLRRFFTAGCRCTQHTGTDSATNGLILFRNKNIQSLWPNSSKKSEARIPSNIALPAAFSSDYNQNSLNIVFKSVFCSLLRIFQGYFLGNSTSCNNFWSKFFNQWYRQDTARIFKLWFNYLRLLDQVYYLRKFAVNFHSITRVHGRIPPLIFHLWMPGRHPLLRENFHHNSQTFVADFNILFLRIVLLFAALEPSLLSPFSAQTWFHE